MRKLNSEDLKILYDMEKSNYQTTCMINEIDKTISGLGHKKTIHKIDPPIPPKPVTPLKYAGILCILFANIIFSSQKEKVVINLCIRRFFIGNGTMIS